MFMLQHIRLKQSIVDIALELLLKNLLSNGTPEQRRLR
jgi:hypothetical protein